MHLNLKTATHLSLSCHVFTLFPVYFLYILLIFICQKIPSGSTSNQVKKTAGESAEIWQTSFRFMFRYLQRSFSLKQWSPMEKDSKPLSEFGIYKGYEVQQHATKTKFLPACMKKAKQDMWAYVRFPHAWYAYFSGQWTQVSRNGILSFDPTTEQRQDKIFTLACYSSQIIERKIARAN